MGRCGVRCLVHRTKRHQRTAKSCGPGAATLASIRPACAGAATVTKKAAHRGEHEGNRKTIARGKPGCFGCTCQIRVHSTLRSAHGDAGAVGARLSLRPLFKRGQTRLQNPGETRRGNARPRVSSLRHSGAPRSGEPGIHNHHREYGFQARDFVAPRNDSAAHNPIPHVQLDLGRTLPLLGSTNQDRGQNTAAREKTTHMGPLKGIKVIDMTSVLMGPFATQALGDYGADVIKVESPEGDVTRQIGPTRHAGMGPVFLNTNRSKRSICLDLKKPAGRDAVLRLLRIADVLVYNVRPQAMARLNLGYDVVSEINPRLIYAGVFGFGQNGPYAAKPAYDDLIQGATGLPALMAQTGDGVPRYVPNALVDRIVGLTAVGAICASLVHRDRTGRGQRVDI